MEASGIKTDKKAGVTTLFDRKILEILNAQRFHFRKLEKLCTRIFCSIRADPIIGVWDNNPAEAGVPNSYSLFTQRQS